MFVVLKKRVVNRLYNKLLLGIPYRPDPSLLSGVFPFTAVSLVSLHCLEASIFGSSYRPAILLGSSFPFCFCRS